MKRIKFMLLSLALVAVVGGALAFKARYSVSYCTTLAKVDPGSNLSTCIDPDTDLTLKCENTVHASIASQTGSRIYCTTNAIFSVAQDTYTCPQGRDCFETTYSVVHE